MYRFSTEVSSFPKDLLGSLGMNYIQTNLQVGWGLEKNRKVKRGGRTQLLLNLLPENWVHLLVGVEPADTTKLKSGGRKDLSFATSKQNTREFSQSSVCSNSRTGEVLS